VVNIFVTLINETICQINRMNNEQTGQNTYIQK